MMLQKDFTLFHLILRPLFCSGALAGGNNAVINYLHRFCFWKEYITLVDEAGPHELKCNPKQIIR
jgi:hypothetical protein